MKDLIERLEAATGPDRDLDVAIYVSEFPFPCVVLGEEAQRKYDLGRAPRYTFSIDAALTLVPEGYNFVIRCYGGSDGSWACVSDADYWDFEGRSESSPTIALCIAALKARGSVSSPDRSGDA